MIIYSLRQAIQTELLQFCDNVFYRRAGKNAAYPRCVFEIDAYNAGDVDRGVLTIDVYGSNFDTTNLEQISDAIRLTFNQKMLITNDGRCACYYDRTLVTDTEDKDVGRRQILFNLRIYEG